MKRKLGNITISILLIAVMLLMQISSSYALIIGGTYNPGNISGGSNTESTWSGIAIRQYFNIQRNDGANSGLMLSKTTTNSLFAEPLSPTFKSDNFAIMGNPSIPGILSNMKASSSTNSTVDSLIQGVIDSINNGGTSKDAYTYTFSISYQIEVYVRPLLSVRSSTYASSAGLPKNGYFTQVTLQSVADAAKYDGVVYGNGPSTPHTPNAQRVYDMLTPDSAVYRASTTVRTLDHIAVTPKAVNMTTNSTYTNQKVKVTAYYTNGQTSDVTNNSNTAIISPASNVVYYSASDGYLHSGANTGGIIMDANYTENGIKRTDSLKVDVVNNTTSKALLSITVTPSNQTITGFGIMGDRLAVVANYSDGTKTTVTSSAKYISSDSSIATINSICYAKSGSRVGTATITVQYTDGVTRSTTAKVIVEEEDDEDDDDQPNQDVTLDSIIVTPNTQTITGFGVTGDRLEVVANYSDGTKRTVTSSASYISSNNSIATINSICYPKSGSTAGTATITVRYTDGVTRSTTARVIVTEDDGDDDDDQPNQDVTLDSITVTPSTQTIKGFGVMGDRLAVVANYSDGTKRTVTSSANYTSSNNSITTINSICYAISGNTVGTATITVRYTDGVTKSTTASVTVIDNTQAATLQSITATPSTQTITGYGVTGNRLTVVANYSDGTTRTVTSSSSYNSSNDSIATINSTYYAKSGNTAGTATITINYTDGVTKSTTVRVIVEEGQQDATLQSITATPSTQTITGYGVTGNRLTVVANYSDGTTRTVTSSSSYNSSNDSIATINSTYYAKSGSIAGTAIITVTYIEGGRTSTDTVNVIVCPTGNNTGILKGIEVTPTQKTIYGLNTISVPVTVTAVYDNGSRKDVTNASIYDSVNSSIATVNELTYRLKSGVKEGNTYIEVTYTEGGITKYESIYVKVIDDEDIDDEDIPEGIVELTKIEIIPGEKETIVGFGEYGDTLKVKAYYNDDTTDYVTEDVEFESEDEDVAYITSSYKVKSGDDEGTVTITATYEEDGITKKDSIDVKVVEEDDDEDIDDDINSDITGLKVELSNKENSIKYLEGTKITYYVDYYNGTDEDLEDVEITLTFPKKMTVIDSDGGTKTTTKITWDVGTVDEDDTGRYEVVLKYDDVSGTDEVVLVAKIYEDNDEEDDSQVKNFIYERNASGQHDLYMYGYPDGTFRPENKITRQELAAAVVRIFNLGSVGSTYSYGTMNSYNSYSPIPSRYKDVTPQTCWGYNEIMTATNLGLLSGYNDGTFRPEAPITKAEFLTIIARRVEVANKETLTIHFPQIRTYWAANEIEQLYRLKLLLDSDLVTKNVTQAITRAEVVTILNRVNYRGPLRTISNQYWDVTSYYWASGDIQEASVSHSYSIDITGEEIER
ncbi:MAG: hypothetical protein A2Y18_02995 [Clostridiales bacterium GWD2_32_19]|nr:MAG: hypothetical protein A2Y18_02995 [Clostridiales bacterium GWD2_32_19]